MIQRYKERTHPDNSSKLQQSLIKSCRDRKKKTNCYRHTDGRTHGQRTKGSYRGATLLKSLPLRHEEKSYPLETDRRPKRVIKDQHFYK